MMWQTFRFFILLLITKVVFPLVPAGAIKAVFERNHSVVPPGGHGGEDSVRDPVQLRLLCVIYSGINKFEAKSMTSFHLVFFQFCVKNIRKVHSV